MIALIWYYVISLTCWLSLQFEPGDEVRYHVTLDNDLCVLVMKRYADTIVKPTLSFGVYVDTCYWNKNELLMLLIEIKCL